MTWKLDPNQTDPDYEDYWNRLGSEYGWRLMGFSQDHAANFATENGGFIMVNDASRAQLMRIVRLSKRLARQRLVGLIAARGER